MLDTIPSSVLAGKARKLESKRSQRRRRRSQSTSRPAVQAVRFAATPQSDVNNEQEQEKEHRNSYIDMASATSDSPPTAAKQPQHAREESGYLSSTIGSSVPNLHTIGVSRGAALLSNRPLGAGGSAPPASGSAAVGGPVGRQVLTDYFQNPNTSSSAAPLAERYPGGLPANAAFESDDDDGEDQHHLLAAQENGSEMDFGLDSMGASPAVGAGQQRNISMTSNEIVNADGSFYKLGGSNAGMGTGHVLSSEALAGESSIPLHLKEFGQHIPRLTFKERMLRGIRQSPSIHSEIAHIGMTRASSTLLSSDTVPAHEASYSSLPSAAQPAGNGLVPPRTTKVSLGSPFAQNQQQQQATASGNDTIVVPITPIVAKERKAAAAATITAGNGRANGNGNGNGSSRKPPPVAGNTAAAAAAMGSRTRKASDASERSVKKDDLLERLATALKCVCVRTFLILFDCWKLICATWTTCRYERKLVDGFKKELMEAEETLNKVRPSSAVQCVPFQTPQLM